MKNVLVATYTGGPQGCAFTCLEAYVRAQLENSLDLGWAPKDILFLADFDYEFRGVKARRMSFRDARPPACKVFAAEMLLQEAHGSETFWIHDLDAWQNVEFACPPFRELGICQHRKRITPDFNSGSVFYRAAAGDIVARLSFLLRSDAARQEETTLNQVLNEAAYRPRITVLNPTYNVGCTNFGARYLKSELPVRVCHFHPERSEHVAIHIWGQNILKTKTVGRRLEGVLRRYFDIASDPHAGRQTAGSPATQALPANLETTMSPNHRQGGNDAKRLG
jgi:hypothetical protein